MTLSDFVSALRITGVISPPSIATATPISECLKRRMRSSAHTAFAAGTRCSASAQRLDDEIVDRELECRVAVLVLRRGGVGLFAQRQQPADLDIGGEIEMRDGLLRLHQPRRDGAAHAVERHFFERRGAIQRLDLLGGRTCGRRRGARRSRTRRALDVARDDAAVRAGAADA